jgi:chromosome segregation ATPase
MARSGINKALVKMAIQRLKAKGEHPSIDAIRVELGNTGSKTTISRYVTELNDEDGVRLSNADALGSTITEIIADLANQLQSEAQATVAQAAGTYETEVKRLKGLLDEWEHQLKQSKQLNTSLEQLLAQSNDELATSKANGSELLVKIERQAQQLIGQDALIHQKDAHIQSIEEKHQHARESLEHYRESVKEQRDQEQRRHEHQVQQLQSEIRQLGQTISIKQADITQLTKDSARLAAELTESRKQLRASEQNVQSVAAQLKTCEESLVNMTAKVTDSARRQRDHAEEITSLKQQLVTMQQASQSMHVELITTKTELNVKNQLFETLQPRAQ